LPEIEKMAKDAGFLAGEMAETPLGVGRMIVGVPMKPGQREKVT